MNNYDVIIIGASISGLVSGLSLVKSGKKVLIVDSSNNVGGLSKSIVQGRFEFEPSFHTLFTREESKYSLGNVLNELGISKKIELCELPDVFRIITTYVDDNNVRKDYVMPFGLENFANRLEDYVTGSKESMLKVFELASECKDALNYIFELDGKIDESFMEEHYPNFMKVSSYSVSRVLDELEMPLEAQEIINGIWVYLGSPETEISFVHYATLLYDAVNYGLLVPKNRTTDIINVLFDKYLELGGDIKFNSKVINILVDSNRVNGVRLFDGTIIFANRVISSNNYIDVYSNLIDTDKVPEDVFRNINQRELGARELNVYLGLNRSIEELGIDNYSFFLYNSLDSDLEFNRMKKIKSGDVIATVYNRAVDDASPDGTSMITLTTLYFDDCYGNSINSNNYYDTVNEIVESLIESFTETTGINIKEYIEEIKIVSPIDVAKFNNSPDGSVYGFRYRDLDNIVPRLLNQDSERYIKGLYISDGFNGDLYGVCSTYAIGMKIADQISKELGE